MAFVSSRWALLYLPLCSTCFNIVVTTEALLFISSSYLKPWVHCANMWWLWHKYHSLYNDGGGMPCIHWLKLTSCPAIYRSPCFWHIPATYLPPLQFVFHGQWSISLLGAAWQHPHLRCSPVWLHHMCSDQFYLPWNWIFSLSFYRATQLCSLVVGLPSPEAKQKFGSILCPRNCYKNLFFCHLSLCPLIIQNVNLVINLHSFGDSAFPVAAPLLIAA